MKSKAVLYVALQIIAVLQCNVFRASGDAILMSNNHVITGSAIQTNEDDVLILTPNAAYNFSKLSIKGIVAEPAITLTNNSRLPGFERAVLLLSQQFWATNLSPIPATVIDNGVLRNVPYSSFHCGADYEVNIYGDLENPACIEIGVYRELLNNDSAKQNCLSFINKLLSDSADKEVLQKLNLSKDLKTRDDLTFEITPPTAPDSYNGWWVSVYSVKQLNQSRASDAEMDLISMLKSDAEKDAQNSTNFGTWSSEELKQTRPSAKRVISFVNTSGVLITNAEVVRVIDGVSLIWRNGPTSGGMIRLADLPEDLRSEFGYDEVKTKAADELAKAQKARWQQQVQAAQAASVQYNSTGYGYDGYADDSNYSSSSYGSGRVYVHGYYRKNGTYVHSYTRSYPHKR